MVSLEWAASLGYAIPENWHPEVLAMSEDKCKSFAKKWPRGKMILPEPVKKPAPKKTAKKTKPKSKSLKQEEE